MNIIVSIIHVHGKNIHVKTTKLTFKSFHVRPPEKIGNPDDAFLVGEHQAWLHGEYVIDLGTVGSAPAGAAAQFRLCRMRVVVDACCAWGFAALLLHFGWI